MTTIGSTTYSYSIYNFSRANGQAEAGTGATETKTSRGSFNAGTSGILSGGDDAGTAKLSSALWQLASTSENSAKDEAVWNGNSTAMSKAEQEFSKFAQMDVAEFIRAKYLEERGLTEESLAQMDPDARAAIEEEIRKAVQLALGIQTDSNGRPADAVQTAGKA